MSGLDASRQANGNIPQGVKQLNQHDGNDGSTHKGGGFWLRFLQITGFASNEFHISPHQVQAKFLDGRGRGRFLEASNPNMLVGPSRTGWWL